MSLTSRALALKDAGQAKLARRQAIKVLHDQADELRVQYGNTAHHLERVLAASPAKADVLANLDGVVDGIARQWWSHPANLEPFVRAVGGQFFEASPGGPRTLRAGTLPDQLWYFGAWGPEVLCALAGDAIVSTSRRHLEAVGYEGGAPWAERLPLIAELEARLKALEQEHTQICDEAAEEGIALELLPHVAQRRAAEQIAAERRAKAEVVDQLVNAGYHRRQAEREG